MSIGVGLFFILLVYLFFTDRGGCGCLLLILAIIGAITVV